jgi:hypothetical protein
LQASSDPDEQLFEKEINLMNATTKTPLVIAFAVVAVLFLLFGIGAMMNAGWMGTGWTNGNGMMGNGWMGGSGMMGGISWMWIPTLLTLGIGILLGWAIFGKK